MNIERRYIPATELRVTQEGETRKLVGYAAVFNSLSEDLGGFREKIAPGAFKKTIKNEDVRALFNHDQNFVLGRKSAKTLRLKEDEHGLHITNTPPGTQWARDLMISVDRGDINQMSFGFRTISDNWEVVNNENHRTLLDVELFDVSPVTFPAYPATEVQARSLLSNVDVDVSRLNQALIRIEHRLALLEGDEDIIKRTISKLNSLLPSVQTHKGEEERQEKQTLELDILDIRAKAVKAQSILRRL